MSQLFYNFFIQVYILSAKILALFQPKAKRLLRGRKNLLHKIEEDFADESLAPIWFHCASLGEFEQGRPLMEAIKANFPKEKILLTFFSPSGYEIRKNYSGADFIYYLPFDTPSNVSKFLNGTQPKLAIFVKYEFWHNYLKQLHDRAIPTLVVSANFQERHAFFKWYGSLQRKMLSYVSHFFVQNENSQKLLSSIGFDNVSIAGDTRIDRAVAIATEPKDFPLVAQFKGDQFMLVAGSTWKEDEQLLSQTLDLLKNTGLKLLIAPHEIHAEHINAIKEIFKAFDPAVWSDNKVIPQNQVLIVDAIGQLAYLYRYADYVWIGGGFNKTGIHNSIEAAAYSKPLFWGPIFNRYQEAIDLINSGAAISCADSKSLAEKINYFIKQPMQKEKAEQAARQYIDLNKGATEKILQYIKQQNIF